MLPFTPDEFFAVFEAYHRAVWPLPLFAYALGLVALALVRSRLPQLQRAPFVIVSLLWLWTGISYFSMHFWTINPAARAIGFAFLLGGGALIVFGLGSKWPDLRPASALRTGIGWFLALYALALYPLFNAQLGHVYPAAPSFGITPCPLTLFTFALLLLTPVRTYRWLYIFPVGWAIIGGSSAFLMGLIPDSALLLSAAAVLLLSDMLPRRRPAVITGSPQPA